MKPKLFASRILAVRQRGMVLIVAMIMVLLMTIVGLAAIRGSGLQELMAGNMRDMQLRFQAAEVGLRVGETRVDATIPFVDLPIFNDSTPGFLTNRNVANQIPVSAWKKADWEGADTIVATPDLQMPSRPRYVVEEVVIPATLEAASTGSAFDLLSLDYQEEGRVFRASSYYSDTGNGAGVFVQSLYKH